MTRNTLEEHPETWQQHSFRAMGCLMAIWLESSDDRAAETAFAKTETLFMANELVLSRFRPDSELSQLNARSGQWTPVSSELWEVLTLALAMAEFTEGWFDPTTLNALEHAGYTASYESLNRVGPASRQQAGLPLPGRWNDVELDEDLRAVRLPLGVRVDLGGIAKGYTAQQAVEQLRALGPCLVDAGGDLVAGDAPHGFPGWPVAISAPWTGEESMPADLCRLWLANQALATSGVDYRTWERDGRRMHHLIDPLTGEPATSDGLTVTVLAHDASLAEAWATATLIAGSDAGLDALLEMELAGLMVTRNGQVLVTPAMHVVLQARAAD